MANHRQNSSKKLVINSILYGVADLFKLAATWDALRIIPCRIMQKTNAEIKKGFTMSVGY